MNDERETRLQVADADLVDVGEARARISRDLFETMKLDDGSIVQISGRARILARAFRAPPADDGLRLIRLDGTARHKLGVALGDDVRVRRHDRTSAERVRCVALGSSRALQLSPYDLRASLVGETIIAGDTFSVSPARRDFRAEVSLLGLRLIDVSGSSAGSHAALIKIVDTVPRGVVQVTDETEIELISASESDDAPRPDGPDSDQR